MAAPIKPAASPPGYAGRFARRRGSTMPPPFNFDADRMPGTPAPPRGGESADDYDKRCGPFVRIGNSLYQKSLLEWMERDRKRRAALPVPPDVRATYTLKPRRRLLRAVLWTASCGALAAAAWWATA